MFNANVSVINNIAIVQSQGSYCTLFPVITEDDLPKLYGTVMLPIAQRKTVVKEQFPAIELLFGSWAENGDEDEQLEKLYQSRLIQSISLHE
jgi:hypothetical protein